MRDDSYVLITAAKNEEAYIERVLQSVVNQTCLPESWVIVSDGSTDRTDDIVREWAKSYEFISLLRLNNGGARVFSSQAFASNAGYDRIKDSAFEFIGFLDADITFDSTYYQKLLNIFAAHPQLGVAGGEIFERVDGEFQPRAGNSIDSVAGAIQFFRRQCYDEIGSRLIPLRYGGHDFVANAMAMKAGWQVRSVSGLPVFHHRTTGTAGTSILRARYRTGLQDYFMGYQALFAAGKCVRRISHPPLAVGSVAEFLGYFLPWVTLRRRTVPDEFVRYLKQQQWRRFIHPAYRKSA
jgi:poly-beta-1,6-N-acetyl-D-glucosamine synthase